MDPAMECEVRALGRQQAMAQATARGDSAVQAFFEGASVLVTGFSGFLGKQLVEKLLRSCPKIKKVYLLFREKRGVDAHSRLRKILEDPVFDAVRKEQPHFEEKLIPMPGDISELGLGLSEDSRRTLTKEVNVIFHVAATTRFDETLKVATNTNVRGTRELVILAREIQDLQALVHVSTAYSSATKDLINSSIEEKFYTSPIDPTALIDMANSTDVKILDDITPKLIQGWPNTYTFTKRVSEELIRSMAGDLPICIIRPTIVISTYNEPAPGWIEPSCAYGASGLIIGVGLGLIHVQVAEPSCQIDLVPADQVNNLTIVAAWETRRRWLAGDQDLRIYMHGSTNRNPITFNELQVILEDKLPQEVRTSVVTLYYIFSLNTPHIPVAYVLYWLLHYIPAYLVDGILMLLGKKPMLNKVYDKAWKLSTVLSYFLVNQWTFKDDNTTTLYDQLSKTDRDIFNFDTRSYDWNEMIAMWVLGIRKYIVKDGLKDSEYASKKQKWLKIVHYFVMALYAYLWLTFFRLCYWMLSFLFRF